MDQAAFPLCGLEAMEERAAAFSGVEKAGRGLPSGRVFSR